MSLEVSFLPPDLFLILQDIYLDSTKLSLAHPLCVSLCFSVFVAQQAVFTMGISTKKRLSRISSRKPLCVRLVYLNNFKLGVTKNT